MAADKYYSGIGSRDTPLPIQELMEKIAEKLVEKNYILRSGASPGADQAFEKGARNSGGKMEIYLPYAGFEDHRREEKYNYLPAEFKNYAQAEKLAKKYHPNFESLAKRQKMFIVRDVYQVLGQDLNTPSAFVICWTEDGCKNDKERTARTGGTGQAISTASDYGIPIFNLKLQRDRKEIKNWFF